MSSGQRAVETMKTRAARLIPGAVLLPAGADPEIETVERGAGGPVACRTLPLLP